MGRLSTLIPIPQDQVTTQKAYFYTDSKSLKLFQFEDGFTSSASSWNRLWQRGKPREPQQFPVQANLIFQEGEKKRLSLSSYLTRVYFGYCHLVVGVAITVIIIININMWIFHLSLSSLSYIARTCWLCKHVPLGRGNTTAGNVPSLRLSLSSSVS